VGRGPATPKTPRNDAPTSTGYSGADDNFSQKPPPTAKLAVDRRKSKEAVPAASSITGLLSAERLQKV
jgi:hypothetical protein